MAQVYALTCIVDDYAYIGVTMGKLSKRLREHRCLLRNGKHTCRPLQEAWIRNGEDTFRIIPIGECGNSLEERRAAETEAMLAYGFRRYNEDTNSFRPTREATRKGIEASRHVEGNKRSPEANLKRSLAQKGKPKGHGAKISATKQARKVQQVMR